MQQKDKTFSGTTETIDGNEYVNCKFKNCLLEYGGGEIPTINGCSFDDCRWEFKDAAMRTLILLRSMYHGMGVGGQRMVDTTFNEIRIPPGK
jgi:hypothetical protein